MDNPDFSFVFVGQILDKEVYKKIEKRDNVIFLGDKHYDIYPNYVANFDVCIIPYNINEGQHGGDSIKAYEYLLTRKKVVGTKGNGLLDLKKHWKWYYQYTKILHVLRYLQQSSILCSRI